MTNDRSADKIEANDARAERIARGKREQPEGEQMTPPRQVNEMAVRGEAPVQTTRGMSVDETAENEAMPVKRLSVKAQEAEIAHREGAEALAFSLGQPSMNDLAQPDGNDTARQTKGSIHEQAAVVRGLAPSLEEQQAERDETAAKDAASIQERQRAAAEKDRRGAR